MIHLIRVKNLFLVKLVFLLIFLSACETIKNKSNEIVKKENEKLSQYIGKSLDNLKMDLGRPDEDFKNEKGNIELVYNSKKYLVPCERRFEIDSNSIVIGFVSNWCF